MKKLWAISLALLISSATALAADMKIGVVDVQQILHGYAKVTQTEDQLKRQFTPQQQKLVDMQKQVNDEITKFNRDSSVMKAADKKAAQDKIIAEQKKFQDMQIDFQKKFIMARDEAMQSILKEVQKKVDEVAKEQKLTLVILRPALAYSDDALNITNQVTQKLK